EASGRVETHFSSDPSHIGFEGIVHGGVLATILDEAMVWAATWQARRFCVCAEMTVRFRKPAQIGHPLKIVAEVAAARPRLITTSARVVGDNGEELASGSGKYVAMSDERHRMFMNTLLEESGTRKALALLKRPLIQIGG